MLQNIRDRIHGWIAGIIIGLLIITFAMWGIQSYLGSGGGSVAVAKVNGKTITQQQLDAMYQRIRQAMQEQSGGSLLALNQSAQLKLKQQALQQLITQQVLSQAAHDNGFQISPGQIDDVVTSLPAFQVDGKFSQERFQEILNATNYSQEQFLSDLQKILLINQMQNGITTSSFGLNHEAESAYSLSNQQRDIDYLIIPATQFLASVQLTPDAIAAYYQQHKEEYQTPEQVSLQYIELSPTQLEQSIHISDQQLQQHYQNNIQAYTKNGKPIPYAQVKNEIEKLLTQQKMQEQFSRQSEQLSELTYTNPSSLTPAANALNLTIQNTDPITPDGGKIGLIANPQIIAAAFSNDVLKNGNNSSPIALSNGSVVVLRVKNYQPATIQPLSAVTATVQQNLREQMAQKEAKNLGTSILHDVQSGGNLQAIARQHHLSWQFANSITRAAPGIVPQILRAVFALPTPTDTNKPSITGVALPNGDYALVAVKKVIASAKPTVQQQKVFQNEIQTDYADLENQLYLKDLMRRAKVKMLK